VKECRKCRAQKALTEFHRWKYGKDGLKAYCKTCNIAAAQRYAQDNAVSVAARQVAWTAANPDKRRANTKAWVERNPELARQRSAARTAKFMQTEAYRVWLDATRGQRTAVKAKHKVKRRSLEEAAAPAWANQDVIKLYYIYADALGMHVDHIVPVVSDKVCGLHWEGNFQLLTPRENSIKGNRHWPDMPAP
jgi:hypothetical protein